LGRKVHDEILSSIPEIIGSYKHIKIKIKSSTKLIMNIEKTILYIKQTEGEENTLFLEMNMPELVRTSLNVLSPERLSATADLLSSDLA